MTDFGNNVIEIPLYIAHSRGIGLEKIMYVRELRQFTFCDILERDVLEWLAGLQDGYDNERGDDSLSGQSDQMEQNINHPHFTIQVNRCC